MDAERLKRIRDAAAQSRAGGGSTPPVPAAGHERPVAVRQVSAPAAQGISQELRQYAAKASEQTKAAQDAKQPQSLADTRTPDETPEERIARIKREEDEAAMAQMSASFASRSLAPAAPKPQPKSAAEAANALAQKFGIRKESQ